MVIRERVTQVFLDLARINSPSGSERGVADYAIDKLVSLGFEVEEDDAARATNGNAGNVIAFRRGTVSDAKPIFLCAHMDTVEPTEQLRIVFDGCEIRSDGTTILGADDKAGIAAMIEGAQSILESGKPHGDIQMILTVAEESGILGAKALDKSKIRAEMGFVFDMQKPVAGIMVSAPSQETIDVKIHGKATHAGLVPEQGVSAIVAASSAVARMKLGRIDNETTANVGTITGGTARNVVPDLVTIEAEARSHSESKLRAQVEHMRRVFEEEAEAVGARAVFRTTREFDAFRWSPSDEVIRLAAAAARKIGIEPSFHESGGGSDANIFNSAGIPTVVVNVGFDGAHSASEHISVDDLATAAEFAGALIETAGDTNSETDRA